MEVIKLAIAKVILNGETLMDVTSNTVDTNTLISGYTATRYDGVTVSGNVPNPEFYDVYKSIARTNTIISNISNISYFIENISPIPEYFFEEVQFKPSIYNFSNAKTVGYGAFACPLRINWTGYTSSIIFNFPVCSEISAYGFYYRTFLTDISCPSCTVIGASAFQSCR